MPAKGTRRVAVAAVFVGIVSLAVTSEAQMRDPGGAGRLPPLRSLTGPPPFNPTGAPPLQPTGRTPFNPTGAPPLRPTGETPFNPTGAPPIGATGPTALDPTGSLVAVDRGAPEVVARSFFCEGHGRGFASEGSFDAHLARDHGVDLSAVADQMVDGGGVWVLPR
jgi:hypothetical protein